MAVCILYASVDVRILCARTSYLICMSKLTYVFLCSRTYIFCMPDRRTYFVSLCDVRKCCVCNVSNSVCMSDVRKRLDAKVRSRRITNFYSYGVSP